MLLSNACPGTNSYQQLKYLAVSIQAASQLTSKHQLNIMVRGFTIAAGWQGLHCCLQGVFELSSWLK